MNYLHIMPDSIYSKDYMERIYKLYNPEEHYFVVIGWEGRRRYPLKEGIVAEKIDNKQMRKIIRLVFASKQVILHSLYIDKKMHAIFAIMACMMPHKFSWYVWSADLYKEHREEAKIRGIDLKKRVKRWCRVRIIRHLHKIIVVAEGDYLYAKQAYGTKAALVQAEYAYNLMDKEMDNKEKQYITILAGHNASPSLLHKDMYRRLEFLKTKPAKIISIMSYPETGAYRNEIIQYGHELFGENYRAITEWMSYSEYISLLNEADGSLFEGDCQNGAGNIFNLIYLGKKVYLSKENSIYQQLRKNGILCFLKEEIEQTVLTPLTSEQKQGNREKIKKLLSDETFKNKWDKVFE